MSADDSKAFDPFELTAAILLGLGAIGASVAGHQSGLWGGQSVEAYGEAAALTTKASTTYNDELSTYLQDTQIDIRAKELIWEGEDNKDQDAAGRQLAMASWMLITQTSDAAYKHLKLPPETRKAYWEGDQTALLPHESMLGALETDLDQDYVEEVFAHSEDEFAAADKRFGEGRDANNKGDEFSLAGVVLTVALFFAGISLIFKSKVRWVFLTVGALILACSFGFMATLSWA